MKSANFTAWEKVVSTNEFDFLSLDVTTKITSKNWLGIQPRCEIPFQSQKKQFDLEIKIYKYLIFWFNFLQQI